MHTQLTVHVWKEAHTSQITVGWNIYYQSIQTTEVYESLPNSINEKTFLEEHYFCIFR